MLYQNFIERLNEEGVEYLVAGGMAVNLYGYIRATMDLDILLMLDETNTAKFIKIAKGLGYKPRIPVRMEDFSDPRKREDWIEKKNTKVFSVYNPENEAESVDVLIEERIDFRTAFKRREVIKSGNTKVNLIGMADLIRLKEAAGRARDKIDIQALKKIRELRREK